MNRYGCYMNRGKKEVSWRIARGMINYGRGCKDVVKEGLLEMRSLGISAKIFIERTSD